MAINQNYILILVALACCIGQLVNGQCDKGPKVWKRPEECCKFNLIKESVFQNCEDEHHGPPGNGKPPKGGTHKHGKGIKGSCHIECAFNETGLYDGKALNENQIRKIFTETVNSNNGLKVAVTNALDTCLPLAKSRSTEFSTALTKGEKCNPVTNFVFMCVTGNIVAKCPAADFETKDAACVSLQKYFNQCPNGPQ